MTVRHGEFPGQLNPGGNGMVTVATPPIGISVVFIPNMSISPPLALALLLGSLDRTIMPELGMLVDRFHWNVVAPGVLDRIEQITGLADVVGQIIPNDCA